MKINPLYFKEFKTKSISEFESFLDRYFGYDLLILIRTKYNDCDEWNYSYELLRWNYNGTYEWQNDWYEGQEYYEYIGGAVMDYYVNMEGTL